MPTEYQIRVKAHLSPDLSGWFDGLTLMHTTDGETLLTGPVIDQAALYGLLMRCRDLGLTLIAVNPVNAHYAVPEGEQHHEQQNLCPRLAHHRRQSGINL